MAGTTTTFEIPAHLLRPGERYLVNLIFDKAARCDTDAASGLRRCVLFGHTTGFYIHTMPAAAASPPRSATRRFSGATDCCGGGSIETGFERPSFDPF